MSEDGAELLDAANTGLLQRSASEQSDCAHGTGGAGHIQSFSNVRFPGVYRDGRSPSSAKPHYSCLTRRPCMR